GPAERDGSVSLAPGPGWDAFPHVLPDPADHPGAPDPAPAANVTVVRYRGREPAGELVLSAVRPAFAASVETRSDRSNGRPVVVSVIRLDVSAGLVGGVAVFEPGVVNPARTWKVSDGSNTVAAATPVRLGELPAALALLGRPGGGLGPIVAAAGAGREPPGTLWLVRFSRPVDDEVVVETSIGLDDPAAVRAWTAGQIGLTVRGAAPRTVQPSAAGGPTPPRPADTPLADWVVGDLGLSTACGEREQLATFRGVITSRGGREFPLTLPEGAATRAAAVGGKAVDPASLGGEHLQLPIPAGDGPVAFEVEYRLPRQARGFAWSVASPAPEVPGSAGGVRREWVFAPGMSAAWPVATRTGTGSAAGGETRSDYPGEEVVVIPDRLASAAGVGLAALVGGLGWLGVRSANRSAGLALLTLLAGAGVAVAAGPPAWGRAAWPVLAVGLPAAAAVAVSRGRIPRPAAGAGLVLAAAVGASAQSGGPDVVFILSAPGGETVLAPPALLARLDAL
ncbi:MAG TPA: hypothetical protein VH092_05180, partial [Urbifossiella sp.]|nr:hypothetical protein [Urbifossiella sp.]